MEPSLSGELSCQIRDYPNCLHAGESRPESPIRLPGFTGRLLSSLASLTSMPAEPGIPACCGKTRRRHDVDVVGEIPVSEVPIVRLEPGEIIEIKIGGDDSGGRSLSPWQKDGYLDNGGGGDVDDDIVYSSVVKKRKKKVAGKFF